MDMQIIKPHEKLTPEQFNDMCRITTTGLEGKFGLILPNDNNRMYQVVLSLFEECMLPLGERFAAVKDDKVVSVVLLNTPLKQHPIRFIVRTIKIAGLVKAIRILYVFHIIDGYNRKRKEDVAEVYWISTDESYRGKGIASKLLEEVLRYTKDKCNCIDKSECWCKVKILVFAKNRSAIHIFQKAGFHEKEVISTGKLVKLIGSDYDELLLLEVDVDKIETSLKTSKKTDRLRAD